MSGDRHDVVELVARERWIRADEPTIAGWLQRLCRAAVRELSASGVGVCLLSDTGDMLTVAASDPSTAAVEELQLTLGQGPCVSAYTVGGPVLIPDLSATQDPVWDSYASAVRGYGVRSVFAFPLRSGAASVGALDVYCQETGDLSEHQTLQAFAFAEIAVTRLLEAADYAGGLAALFDASSDTRLELHQAQGMVMIQLGVGPEEALVRVRAHAFVSGRRLSEVTDDILTRQLVLERDDP